MSLVALFNVGLAWLAYLLGVRTKKSSSLGRGQTVVIVGGGFAGVTLAHYLETTTQFQVVLFDRKEYFEFTPSMLRNMVEPSHWKRTSVRYADMPMLQSPRIRLVLEEVVTLTDKAVQAKSGEWCKYDKLVLAMGSDYYGEWHADNGTFA
jgi:NADH dehydrogenase FAD-containing subunit